MKKVVVLGPECTGKSELSEFLAREFQTVWVPEFARQYINDLGRPYEPSDLLNIARGQISSEDNLAAQANELLICDTNLYVIKIWSMFKYGFCHREILDAINERKYDLYLLTYIDIPWEADPLREHPHERERLYELYLNEMRLQPVPFIEIKGHRQDRRRSAVEGIKTHLL
jgi:NadR type nicotinamide-nucleotide adenylyltransferase